MRRFTIATMVAAAGLALLVGVVVAVVILTGVVSVSASEPQPVLLERLLSTARERSIEARLADITVPPLDDPKMIELGLVHYQEMCVTCHGAPGVEPSEIGLGLSPHPPRLDRHGRGDAEEAAEAFWIVKNGIWATGMPAFGPTHTDQEVWAMVALVERLPALSAAQYSAMVRDAGLDPGAVAAAADGEPPATAPQSDPAPGEAGPHAHTHTHTHTHAPAHLPAPTPAPGGAGGRQP